jgi:hypothetical protein
MTAAMNCRETDHYADIAAFVASVGLWRRAGGGKVVTPHGNGDRFFEFVAITAVCQSCSSSSEKCPVASSSSGRGKYLTVSNCSRL